MAGVASKKPFGDMGVQATFPYVFNHIFEGGTAYFPSDSGPQYDIMVGTHYQSEYHELKRLEANQSVVNRGINNRSAQQKLLTGPHNYHVPKPVLGQRLYANPSLGDNSAHSTRRDNGKVAPFRTIEVASAEEMGTLRGGVVTTREGYDFYRAQLNRRIGQLNDMNALALGVAVPMGSQYETYDNTRSGPPSKVDFFILLRGLQDAITEGDLTRFTFENLKELTGKLFQMAPTASVEDFNDIIDAVDIMLEDLELGLSEIADNAQTNAFVRPDYASTLQLFMDAIKDYTAQMFSNINRSEKDKKTLSNSLIKSLGFSRLLRNQSARGAVIQQRMTNTRVDQEAENFDDVFDEGGDDGRPYNLPKPREDSEQQGAPRAALAGENGDPNRDQFGAQRGAFGDAPQFFGDQAPTMVAPLGLAGADTIGQPVGRVDPAALGRAARDAVDFILNPQITPATAGMTRFALIQTLYPDPEIFVDDVADRMFLQNFNVAEIAEGLKYVTDVGDVFSKYISENAGPLGPESISAPDVIQYDIPLEQPALPSQPSRTIGRKPPQTTEGPPPWDYPATREELRTRLNTIPKIQAFGARIPAFYGGPYKPRTGSYVKSAIAHLIKLIKKADPNY
jgi:hypothetical protein